MNVLGSLLRQLGWSVHLQRVGLGMRWRRLMTLVVVFGGLGTALGYTMATRGITDEQRGLDPDRLG